MNKLTVSIYHDDAPFSPREDDNYGTIVAFARNYSFNEVPEVQQSDFTSWQEMEEYLVKQCGAILVLPVYMYKHSDIALSTRSFMGRAHHASWDSGRIGLIYTTRKQVELLYGPFRLTKSMKTRLSNWLTNEVEEYGRYVNGEVFGYTIEDEDGEQVDGAGGFIGSEYALEEATSAMNSLLKNLEVTYA